MQGESLGGHLVFVGPKATNSNGEEAHCNEEISNLGSFPHWHTSWVLKSLMHCELNFQGQIVTSERKGYNSKCIHAMMARNTRL